MTSSEGLDVLDQRKGGMSLRTGVTLARIIQGKERKKR